MNTVLDIIREPQPEGVPDRLTDGSELPKYCCLDPMALTGEHLSQGALKDDVGGLNNRYGKNGVVLRKDFSNTMVARSRGGEMWQQVWQEVRDLGAGAEE